jgi:PHD/YefM family antitoxin component YafN of YafNO toxin-antitoxin module
MQTIPASEIKRRGISAVDECLREGPVHVIRNDRPMYVILSQEQYAEFVEAQELATLMRVRESLEDIAAGRVRRGTARDLLAELGIES